MKNSAILAVMAVLDLAAMMIITAHLHANPGHDCPWELWTLPGAMAAIILPVLAFMTRGDSQ